MVLRCMTWCAHIHSPSSFKYIKPNSSVILAALILIPHLQERNNMSSRGLVLAVKYLTCPFSPQQVSCILSFHTTSLSVPQSSTCVVSFSLEHADWQAYMLINKPVSIFGFPKQRAVIYSLYTWLQVLMTSWFIMGVEGGRQMEEEGGRKFTVAVVINCMWRT